MTYATESNEPDKAVLYLRVSSKKQMDTAIDIDRDGNSIATQREVATRKADGIGAAVAREFVEPGVSASTIEKRQVFQDMLTFLRENPDVRYVIVYARSRAFRNYIDAAITKRLLDKLHVRLVSAREDFGDGVFADAMEAVTDIFNDIQNRQNGEDIRIKLQHKATNGGTTGKAPIGYRNVRIEHEGRQINTVELDPKRAPLIRKAFELYATGDYGLERLESTMADLGLTTRATPKYPERPMTFKSLHRMLRDQYYLGYINYKGDVFKGRHEPIVDQELFDRVQEVADFRSKSGQRDRVLQHYLKGALFCARCEHNGRMTRLIYTEARGRSGRRYAYFMWRGRQDGICDLPHLPADGVEQAIADHYLTLALPASFVAEVRRLLEDAVADEQRSVTELHAALNRKIKELDGKEDRLLDLLADDGIPQAKVRAKLRKIQTDRAAAEAGLANAAAEIAVGAGVLLDALDLVSHPDTFYRDGNDTVRRNLNQTFYQYFYIDEHGVQGSRQNPPFADFHAAHALTTRAQATTDAANANRDPLAGASKRTGDDSSSDLALSLADILSGTGSSKNTLVELRGIEPLTYSMRTRFVPISPVPVQGMFSFQYNCGAG
ncbi:Resolvase domain protein [Gordonia bronchialis DSM 43247]|uniref:Resolvase domain protein n=1 Tax=Gordonia bronchialis (strain ATCC 25592 / DSM 43247 / BCRC 13721 / JCM 3198 / KCTC 3076 / NBRC 16047 / NCTC 10667) TaxID=526226 RepID=D0L6F5_GORB4|nr:recombinase family protein [Gordonia bronchialis]ACY20712.1 Resolvase domain protein [Gordonia bronchialis DSM 43247]MCC3323485.1 recombinase family protein [Gordonia bronchialis]QGS25536.1 recombinase family protein [Gordonia bronchialis]STQ63541.1 Resolvase, N terminal domain [Gordonia bronchialis]